MEDHTLITWIALRDSPLRNRTVAVEPLSRFLGSRKSITPADGPNAWQYLSPEQFSRELAINPRYKPGLYLKLVPDAAFATSRAGGDLDFSTIAVQPFPYSHARFRRLVPGERVSALDVLATAADEPDYGMDLGLFSDSGTEWGASYSFGPQPFGNPEHPFSSQAPFHMAFYHESPLLYRVAPELRRSCVAHRIRQFSSLSAEAHHQGCAYWEYRFAGWALHYVQDLTMPYHAAALPGLGPSGVIVRGLLRTLGIKGLYERMIRDVTRKHVLLESLLLEHMHRVCRDTPWDDPLMRALRGTPREDGPPPADCAPSAARDPLSAPLLPEEISRAAARLAPAMDRALGGALERLSDLVFPASPVDAEATASNAAASSAAASSAAALPISPELHHVLQEMLSETGHWTRAFIHQVLQSPVS